MALAYIAAPWSMHRTCSNETCTDDWSAEADRTAPDGRHQRPDQGLDEGVDGGRQKNRSTPSSPSDLLLSAPCLVAVGARSMVIIWDSG
jgi:hypothetical protein